MINFIGYLLTIPVRTYITLTLLVLSPIMALYIIFFSDKKNIAIDLKKLRLDFSQTWRY